MLVHLIGNPCDMQKIKKIVKKHNLWLIEDACEAHGAKYYKKHVGSFGDLSTFSFFASHHITTMEGGMVVTNNKKLYELGKSLRSFGWIRDQSSKRSLEKKYKKIDSRFLFVNVGYNLRPTELQGAFGIHQIKKLENLVKIRIDNAMFWNKKLSSCKKFLILPKLKKHYRKSFLFYPLTVIKNNYFSKQELVDQLEKVGIETRPVMTGNILEQPVTKIIKYRKNGKFTNAQYIMKNSFLLGNHHLIGKSEREFMANTIINFINKKTS
jgi:CDP-6-deoxy-D-xylo-4-hexulose-3-dehydrase